jgi:hypothetical protein
VADPIPVFGVKYMPERVRIALREVERYVRLHWSVGDNAYAQRYLAGLEDVCGRLGEDGARTQILYVLANLTSWHGIDARRAKEVLRQYAVGKDVGV